MNSSKKLSIVFLSLSGIIISLLVFTSIWAMMQEGYLKLTVLSGVMLSLLVLFLIFFFFGYRYTVTLIKIQTDERKRIEQELISYSSRLTSFIENPKYVSIYSLDKKYRYTGFNSLHKREMEEIFNAQVGEGINILEQLPAEMAERARKNYDRALAGEHFTVTSMFNLRYYTQLFNPVYDEDDNIIGLTSNIFDVTDRIKAEQELERYKDQLEHLVQRRTEQLERQTMFFQKIIDNLPNLIFVRDVNHRYILINRAMAESFGCEKEDLIGENVSATHHNADEAKRIESEDEKLFANGGVVEEEEQYSWPDGSKKWLFLSKKKMEIGEDQYILGVHFDITYLKETELKLQQANQELKQTLSKLKSTQQRLVESEKMASLGQLTAGLAHEINNPLNYVSGNVGPIRQDLSDVKNYIKSLEEFTLSKFSHHELPTPPDFKIEVLFDELESLLTGVDEGTARVKSLLKDLNMFSLPEGSRKVLSNINESLESTINLVRHSLKPKVHLHKDLRPLPATLCNPQQLNQVFLNILNNAIQAIEEEGNIKIASYKKDEKIIIEVSDTGIGIPKRNMGKIFDPFFTTKEIGEGTGLGLAISYRIVREHGGQIDVQSKLHKGTTVRVLLPVLSAS